MNGQEGLSSVGVDWGWASDPEPVKEFVAMATAEGYRPSSIDQGRGVLVRYDQFLHEKFGIDLNTAGWKEFAAYKAHLAQTGIARTTVRGYLSYIIAYYRVRAQATQDPQLLDLFTRLKAIGLPRRANQSSGHHSLPRSLPRFSARQGAKLSWERASVLFDPRTTPF